MINSRGTMYAFKNKRDAEIQLKKLESEFSDDISTGGWSCGVYQQLVVTDGVQYFDHYERIQQINARVDL